MLAYEYWIWTDWITGERLKVYCKIYSPKCTLLWTMKVAAAAASAAAKLLQSCPTLCNPIDGSQLSSPVPGILQARTLKWVAISFSNAWKWKVKVTSLNHVRLLETPWTAAYQAPPSMGFSRQEYWSGVPLPSLNEGWTKPFKMIRNLSQKVFFLGIPD